MFTIFLFLGVVGGFAKKEESGVFEKHLESWRVHSAVTVANYFLFHMVK